MRRRPLAVFKFYLACLLFTTPLAADAPPGPAAALDALFAQSDADYLRRNPIEHLRRNQEARVPVFGDMISDTYFNAERTAAQAELAALRRIDRAKLDPARQVSYDMFAWNKAQTLAASEPAIRRLTDVQPLNHFFGWQVIMPQFSSGERAAPYQTVADYEDGLNRLKGYAAYLDGMTERLQQGLARHLTQPRMMAEAVARQLDAQVVDDLRQSIYFTPLRAFPEAIPAPERQRLAMQYETVLRDQLIPAHARLRDFLNAQYIPQARTTAGLGDLSGGDAYYRLLVRRHTSTNITPEAAHELGLKEVDRITQAMEDVVRAAGFSGNVAEFSQFLTTDGRFQPASAEAMGAAFRDIDQRMMAVIGQAFGKLPQTVLELRPTPAFRAATSAFGEYSRGTTDGSRPGIFYFNTHALPTRFTWIYETLYLHEAVPGHHLQVSLSMENPALPNFQRFEGPAAFSEGWALYAESLGYELGFYRDPYQNFGHLTDEILRAMRLVVDTGIHAKGWSRDRAIAYMLAHSAMSRNEVEFEVDRYIAMPAQALSYKVGQITIRNLRAKAERKLGPRFDLRRFHDEVLSSGRISMAVLEQKIERWIKTERASQ